MCVNCDSPGLTPLCPTVPVSTMTRKKVNLFILFIVFGLFGESVQFLQNLHLSIRRAFPCRVSKALE